MKKKFKLTKEEKELESCLNGEGWVEAPDRLTKEIVQAAKVGVSERKREARVNIRLRQTTVDLIRDKAEQEGLGYQTLMSSVLHKYATGRLVEKETIDDVAPKVVSRVQGGGRR